MIRFPLKSVLFGLTVVLATWVNAASAQTDGFGDALKGRVETTLRPDLMIDTPMVSMGDVFILSGERAAIPLLRSPTPGQRVSIPARRLQSVALKYGILWYNTENLDEVVISRESQVVMASDIQAALEDAFLEQGIGSSIEVRLTNRNLAVHLPTDERPDLYVEDLHYDARIDRFDATLVVGVESARRVRVDGRAYPMTDVPVLVQNLPRSDVVRAEDINLIKIPSARLSASVITDTADLVGKAARRSLKAGQTLHLTDIEEPVLVRKGMMVMMTYEVPGMTLTDVGRAMAKGSEGELIPVLNMRSNRTVRAQITSEGQVRVNPKPVIVAANR
ncbi:MAG: flagellar basal body P-ring formation chaperone FlgA [Pseudomonadota bacterium]